MSAFTVLSLCGQCTLKISCPSSPPYMLMFNPSPSPYLTVAAVPVLNTPDDGRLRPKHVEWPCRDKNCTVLHQVGVSFGTNSFLITSLSYSSTCFEHCCAHRQEVKIVLYSICYRHTETSEWSKPTKIQLFSNFMPLTCFSLTIPDAV